MLLDWFRPFWWVLSGCVCTGTVYAQAPEDHLRPAKDYYTSGMADYYVKVQAVLSAGLQGRTMARVVVLPSLSPEYVLSVDQQADKYYLTYHSVHQTSVWHELQAKTGVTPSVDAKTVELRPDVATAVTQLFAAALDQTRYPKPTETSSLYSDGTTFTFITHQRSIGWQAGETWSPPKGTRMGQLVALVERLRQAAITSATPAAQTALLEESNGLRAVLSK